MHAKVFVAADGLEAIGGNTQFSTVEFNGDKQQFDGVVSADSVQTIYDTVLQPLINNLFKGYNVSLLLFGRSDAKKSELVHGGRRLSDRRALLRLAMDSIYDRLEALKMGNNEIPLMSVQMVQLCGELVRDLIDLSKDNITYEENIIKEPYIPDLTKIQIDSLPRGHDVLDKIARNREAIHSSFHPFCTEIFTLEIHHENSPHTPDFWDDQTQSRRSWGNLPSSIYVVQNSLKKTSTSSSFEKAHTSRNLYPRSKPSLSILVQQKKHHRLIFLNPLRHVICGKSLVEIVYAITSSAPPTTKNPTIF
ncbi:hypothetical protein BC829DRAFT_21129 [Chytridium lagenaria]|nr:hypothetical protein BC829DRAFT_21129 [Chytridium lagenaria]